MIAPVTKSVVLQCDSRHAFTLFTEHAGEWWPAERRHTRDAHSVIRIEATGRFFERAGDGTEVELGVVQLFEPGSRLLLDWYPGTGAADPTRVDVRFEEVSGGTRVTIVHSLGRATHDVFAKNVGAYERSWDLVLSAVVDQS